MLGAIAGDIIGSVYEFNNCRRKDFEPLFHPAARYTDDTICTVAVAHAILDGADPVTTLQDWCQRYWDKGSWGKRFIEWMFEDEPKPYGSFGNGGAMRVSAAAYLSGSFEQAMDRAYAVTIITHDHPEGLKGAYATTAAIWWSLNGYSADRIQAALLSEFGYRLDFDLAELSRIYQRTEASQDSVPQAIACALQAGGFEDAIRTAVSIGGDSDTIAAIAGSIAEARFGVPDQVAVQAWNLLPDEMQTLLRRAYMRVDEVRKSSRFSKRELQKSES